MCERSNRKSIDVLYVSFLSARARSIPLNQVSVCRAVLFANLQAITSHQVCPNRCLLIAVVVPVVCSVRSPYLSI